ncbi:hypothetical protein D3C75_1090920 [compost metagenome]
MRDILSRDRRAVIGADRNDCILFFEDGDIENFTLAAVPYGIGEQVFIQPDQLIGITLDNQRALAGMNTVTHTSSFQHGNKFLGQLFEQVAEIYRLLPERQSA